jgi:hypothetical protein
MTTCRDCRFWDAPPGASEGTCRRHAPAPLLTLSRDGLKRSTDTDWPMTTAADWCGEGQPRAESAEDKS